LAAHYINTQVLPLNELPLSLFGALTRYGSLYHVGALFDHGSISFNGALMSDGSLKPVWCSLA
jgi:hypothetical protein